MRKRLIVARLARLLFENRRRRVVSLRVRASLYPVLLLREEQIAAPAERRRRGRRRRRRSRAMITAATAKIIILRDGSMHHHHRRRRRQRGSSIARSSRPLYRSSEHFVLCRRCGVFVTKRFLTSFVHLKALLFYTIRVLFVKRRERERERGFFLSKILAPRKHLSS